MPITTIGRDFLNNVTIVGFTTTDTLATVSAPNYIKNQQPIINALNNGIFAWFANDTILVNAADGNAFYEFTDDTFSSLLLMTSPTGGTVSPGLIDQIAIYPANGNTIAGSDDLPTHVQIHPGSVNNGVNANGTHFWRGDGIWATIASSTGHSIYPVYVAQDGSDITGNGSVNAPYRTIAHALTTITTNDHLHIFNIICSYGIYNETTLSLKPFVSISGTGSELNVTGNIDLDTAWATLGINGGITQLVDFLSATVTGNVSLDFSVAGLNSTKLIMENIDFTSVGGSFDILSGRNSIFTLSNINSVSPNLQNVSGIMRDCNLVNMIFTANSGLMTVNFTMEGCTFSGNVAVNGALIALSANINIYNTKIAGTLSADRFNVTLNIDSNSLSLSSLPLLTNSANVNYINVANTLEANYTPVNYTPDATGGTDPATSVAAHLHGIDNALSTSVNASAFTIYVSSDGDDSTGNGTIDNPYKTVVFALSTITTPTSTNRYTIALLGGTIAETAQVLFKPFVSIVGISEGVMWSPFTFFDLDPSWGTTSFGELYIADLSFKNSDMFFTFSSFVNATSHTIVVSNVNTNGRSISVKGSATTVPILFLKDSIAFGANVENATAYYDNNLFTSNITANVFDPTANNTTIYFNGNTIGGNLDLRGPNAVFNANYYFTANLLQGTLSFSGTNTMGHIDVVSFVLPSLSGASYVLRNTTEGIQPAYTDVTGATQTLAINNGYVANRGAGNVAFTLPVIAPFGSEIKIVGRQNGWTVAQNASQKIIMDGAATTVGVGGSIASTAATDCVTMVCTVANNEWTVYSSMGSITVT